MPPLIAGKDFTFDVAFNVPAEVLKAELVWDSEEAGLRIVSVPEKIIAIDPSTYTLKRIIAVFDGPWSLDLYVQVNGKTVVIQLPIEILPQTLAD